MKCSRHFLFLFIIFFFASCGRKALVTSTDIGGLATEVKGTVLLKVSIAWEGTPDKFTDLQQFQVSGNSLDEGTASVQVSIPEEQLYYSLLKFEVEKPVLDEGCAVVVFRPYYYQKSIEPGFQPDKNSDSTVDCSLKKDPACFGGPAKDLIEGFPLFDAQAKTDGKLSFVFKQSTHKASDGNRYAANDMIDGVPGDTVSYVPGSIKDYTAYCEDIFGNELARINLQIKDDNGTNPGTDHYCSWTSSGNCKD